MSTQVNVAQYVTQIPGLLIWTDASTLALANNATLSTWRNGGSGGTVNCTGTFLTNQLNGLSIVRLNTNQTWTIASQPTLSVYSMFFVTRQRGGTNRRVLQSTTNNQLYGYWSGQKRVIYIDANPNQLANAASDSAWDLFSHTRTAGSAFTFNWNGTSQNSSSSSSANSLTGLAINTGANAPETSDCDVAEIILYNTLLTTVQVQQIEGYLAWKWGLQANLPASHPYKSVPLPPLTQINRISTPLQIPGCQFWFDAADPNGNGVSAPNGRTLATWVDKSGNGRNAVQNVAATYLNNSLIFTGSQYYTLTNGANTLRNVFFCIFIVERLSATGGFFIGDTVNAINGGSLHIGYRNTTNVTFAFWNSDLEITSISGTGATRLWSFVLPSTGSRYVNLNGSLIGTFTNNTQLNTNNGLQIGAVFSGNFYNGSLYEIIGYTGATTTAQIQQVEGYLAWKWGLVNSLPANHPYRFVNAAPLPTITSALWTPSQISGLQLWLDAADTTTYTVSAGSVISWRDKSANAYNFNSLPATKSYPIQGTRINNLTTIGINSNASLRQATRLDGVKNLFYVSRQAAYSTYLFLLGDDTNYDWHGGGPGDSQNYLINPTQFSELGIRNASPTTIFYSGTSITTSFSGFTLPSVGTVFMISASGITGLTRFQGISFDRTISGRGEPGDWAELICYSNALTTAQRQNVEGYLAWKWGLQGSLPSTHPFAKWPPPP